MKFTFHGKRVSGLLAIVPEREYDFLEEMRHFAVPEARALKLKAVMGYNKHRMVTEQTCVSDLCVYGMEYAFREGLIGRDDFDALILVTQCPDHFLPPTSNIIQGRLGLKHDLLCLDINQGCAGFVIGLLQSFLLLEQPEVRRVVLLNAEVLSRKVSPRDKNSFPMAGDAAAITVIEKDPDAPVIHANVKMDGARHEALRIPAGGFRLPASADTAVLQDMGEHNFRALDHLCMDGTAVFNFVQVEVPTLIEDILATAGMTHDAIDYYLFHQPNKFMLEKLADKMGIPYDKMPSNVVGQFGNSSGVTIPMAIASNLSEPLCRQGFQVCLAGFGSGLAWATMLLRLGNLSFCSFIEYPES